MTDKIDKVYDLLEKVYIDLQDTKKGLSGRLDNVEGKLSQIEQGQIRIETVIEHDINKKIDTLFECDTRNYKKLQEHDKKFDSIEQKLEKQDVEIRVIKGGR